MVSTGSAMRDANSAGIQRQIHLPWSKALEISLNSIRNRFWRTLITGVGILLGIAFLVSVLCTSNFAEAAAHLTAARWIAYTNRVQLQETHVRQIWLVSLALLVSTIGIVNSMLMAVAERYREIGTMKCLGALDSFVIRLFVIEAALTGLLASVLGGLVGFLLIFVSFLAQEGTGWLRFADFKTLLIYILISMLAGSLLALLASAWPAAIAAKMPPAEAFRVEV
ncbi:MAG: ABC transporter permease [Chloroflexi bacterium]|nr:ABC transporter permease [Chloroflexota bacterium]